MVTVSGLSRHEVVSVEAVSALLYQGALCRATASTNMNTHSSRYVLVWADDDSTSLYHYYLRLSEADSGASTCFDVRYTIINAYRLLFSFPPKTGLMPSAPCT